MKRGFCGPALCRFRREILPVFRSAGTGKTQVLLYHIFPKKKSDFCGSAGKFFRCAAGLYGTRSRFLRLYG